MYLNILLNILFYLEMTQIYSVWNKSLKQEQHNIFMYELGDASGVFLRQRGTNKFLFHLRDDIPHIADPGMWSLIGGGIHNNETPEEAAIREAEEEIGIKIDNPKYLGTIEAFDIVSNRQFPLKISIFLSEIDCEESDIVLNEGQMVKYFNLDEIIKKKLKPELKQFIIEMSDDLES